MVIFNAKSNMIQWGGLVGKAVKAGKKVINAFIEPQFTMLSSRDAGQPQFQVFFGVNIQSVR